MKFDVIDELMNRFFVSSEKMGIKWDSTSAVHRLQENP
jgi:hypothetical protein